jgi:hypothetical protein
MPMKVHLNLGGHVACGKHGSKSTIYPDKVTCEACKKTTMYASYVAGWSQAVTVMFNRIIGPAMEEVKKYA